MRTNIHVHKDCISANDAQVIINFINDNKELGFYGKNNKRYTIPLGIRIFEGTAVHQDKASKIKLANFPDKVQKAILSAMDIAVKMTESAFKDTGLHVSNIYIAKQMPGGEIPRHIDSGDWDQHLEYSAVLYLNEIEDGDLCFPDLGFCYHPKAFELVIFKSKDEKAAHEVRQISSSRYSLPMWLSKDKSCYVE